MIQRVIDGAIRRRVLVLAASTMLAIAGWWAYVRTPIDAIPDLSDNQVIVFTDWSGHSPQEVEDQVTYPLAVNLQGLAGVRAVRSQSAFGFSMIYVIFEDRIRSPSYLLTDAFERHIPVPRIEPAEASNLPSRDGRSTWRHSPRTHAGRLTSLLRRDAPAQ